MSAPWAWGGGLATTPQISAELCRARGRGERAKRLIKMISLLERPPRGRGHDADQGVTLTGSKVMTSA